MMIAGEIRASIVIPNWNGGDYLTRCLESLARQTLPPTEVIVVDNGSTDSSHEAAPSIIRGAKVIRLGWNHGFSYAVNRGIEEAGCEWIVLLNNDVVLESDFLENLLTTLERQPEYDFAAAKLLKADRRELLDGAGDAILLAGASYRLAHGLPEIDFHRQREVFAACGAAAAYRASMLRDIGGFDEDFFSYLEDVDLAFRARWAGYRCLFIPSSVAHHWGSVTLGGALRPPIVRQITQNQILLVVKNLPSALLARVWMRILWFQLLWLVFAVRRRCLTAWARGMIGALRKLTLFRRKRKEVRRSISVDQMWSQLIDSEKEIYDSFQIDEGAGNALLRAYFAVFPPSKR